jgi:hypothetical protein
MPRFLLPLTLPLAMRFPPHVPYLTKAPLWMTARPFIARPLIHLSILQPPYPRRPYAQTSPLIRSLDFHASALRSFLLAPAPPPLLPARPFLHRISLTHPFLLIRSIFYFLMCGASPRPSCAAVSNTTLLPPGFVSCPPFLSCPLVLLSPLPPSPSSVPTSSQILLHCSR